MPPLGPQLPPHLQPKRKRSRSPDQTSSPSSSSDGTEKRQRILGPSLPPASKNKHPSPGPEAHHDRPAEPRRVLGPSLPPASLSERPPTSPTADTRTGASNLRPASGSDSDSDSDDDFGPAPPPAPGTAAHATLLRHQQAAAAASTQGAAQEPAPKPRREEWMLVPPQRDDLAARADPAKLRARKFNTGKGAKAPASAEGGGGIGGLWTETGEEKRRRLADEVMGIRPAAHLDAGASAGVEKPGGEGGRNVAEVRATDERIRAYNEQNRSTSLYAEHAQSSAREPEDDPSARAFDREKDVGLGVKIGYAKRKELLAKAADFSSRFQKGSYL